MHRGPAPSVRPMAGASGFNVSFGARAAALQVFSEGRGSLTTDHTLSCMEPSHIAYGEVLDERTGEAGARLTLDDRGATCSRAATIAVGHLGSRRAYGYGDFTWRARVLHGPDGGAAAANAFSCFSTYVYGPVHNELAWCFAAAEDGHQSHMSVWYDAKMRRHYHWHRERLADALHDFTVRWRAEGVDWLVDGEVVHQVQKPVREATT